MAANLARMLEEEPIAEHLISEPGRFLNSKDHDGVIHIAAIRQADLKKLSDLITGLKTVSKNALRHSKDDLTFRCAYGLPRHDDAGKLPFVIWLWPRLFEIWELAGKQIAFTPEGPLHRFVSFIHDACGLPEVKASTLRDATADWKKDPWLRTTDPEDPPWWTWGED